MTNNAIASTQKTGEGDAFLFDNSGATRNIVILAKQKAQEAAGEQQAKQQKDKQDYDTQKQFYDGLSDIKLDLYEKDVPFINGKIDDIIKKVADEKMAGRNPFDISNSDAYVGIRGELGKLQAWAAGSKATKAKVRDLQTALYQDKSGVFDKDKTQAALDAYTAYELPERISLDIQPVQAPFNGQAFLTKNLTPTILKSSLPLQKVYTDKTAQSEAQAQLDNLKVQYTPVVDQFLLSTGRYKPEEIPEQRDKYLESLQFKALYDDKQDVKEKLDERKQDELGDYRKQALAIQQQRANAYTKSVDFATTVQDYGTNEFVSYLEAGTPESDQKFINAFLSSANGIGAGDITKVEKGKGKELFATVPLFDSKMEVIIDKESGEPKAKVIKIRDEFGKYNKKSLANSTVTLIYEASQIKNKTSPVEDLTGDPNNNVVAGTKGANKTSTTSSNSSSSKKSAPQKTVVKKGYNSKTNQTQLIYSDGSKEIVNGKR